MFMVLSSWQSYCESSVHPVQAAADPRPSQTNQAVSPPAQAARIYTHHRHLLLLLSPKADTHFTIPQRVEGWSVALRFQYAIVAASSL